MVKRTFVFFVSTVILFSFLISCKEQNENNSLFWGETHQYSNFLFKKYEPVRMEQTLLFEFNEDALERWNDVVSFELVDINTKKKIDDVILYKNGVACDNNILNITTADNDNEVVVGIEFKPTAPEGRYMLALQHRSLNGLDRIDAIELGQGIVIEKEDVMNPLAKWVMWVLVVLAVVLCAWIVVVRLFVHPKTYFNRVDFDYGTGLGKPIRMESAYKLVCTNKQAKRSFFNKIFIGDVKYEVNDFWDKDFVITNGVKRRQVRFEGKANYSISSDRVMKGDSFTVTNSRGEKVCVQL